MVMVTMSKEVDAQKQDPVVHAARNSLARDAK